MTTAAFHTVNKQKLNIRCMKILFSALVKCHRQKTITDNLLYAETKFLGRPSLKIMGITATFQVAATEMAGV